MSLDEPSFKPAPVEITEDEAALYDRQIRLWGLEAQQRMRNATILVVNLRGVATETIKNIVLAGIGKLIIWDCEDVAAEDLGVGFFFRDEDIGKKRVDAAKSRIESLNPLVTVETITSSSVLEPKEFEALVQIVDLVCITDSRRDFLIRANEACRRSRKPMYAGGTYGLLGYIFCDLVEHEYITSDRSGGKEGGGGGKDVKVTVTYSTLREALEHRWSSISRRQTKSLNPAAVFIILALWEFQDIYQGHLPDDPKYSDELETIANTLIAKAEVNKEVFPAIPRGLVETTITTAIHEFSPVCAVVGGMLAQDI
ncbi:hypothetical protein B0F90DRAFT_1815720 [Multifurca ochricompacta]|uniref:Ubiquitin-like 1-activating enzyme E1A n=1 Tax=Multifurca ochricompacta TaxID=376703 RepID=A0AAD4QNV0_9AGAM|nr:hypothetical protein B0F90DRAFT_1815720 [Multifurca ochricompacta]